MREFHGFDYVVHNHCRTQPGAESEKKHSATLVRTDGLHGRVVNYFYRAPQRLCVIKSDPAFA
jgi:hypothetical protein